MYLFSRHRHVSPAHQRQSVADAVEAAARVNGITGLAVSVWMTVFSTDVGSIAWATMFDRLEQLGAANDQLAGADDYLAWVEGIDAHFEGPTTDLLLQIVAGGPGEQRAEYTFAARAVCANGCLEQGTAAAVALAARYEQVTGVKVMVGSTVTGRLGEIVWLGGLTDLAALEQADAALAADPGYAKELDAASAYFLPGTEVITYRRLA